MNKTNELLFSALDGVWTEEEKKEEASRFCEANEPGIITLYAFEVICKYHVRLPQDLKTRLYDVLSFAGLEGIPEYEALKAKETKE